MSEPLATVTAYWRREDAGVAKRALDGAGIDAVVEETAVAKVRVERLDAMRAGDVLNRTCDQLDEVGEADEEPRDEVCPACGSADVESSMRGRLFAAIVAVVTGVSVAVGQTEAAFFILFAAGVYLLTANRWRCGDCGNSWT
jgi:ribosomal protein S27AE